VLALKPVAKNKIYNLDGRERVTIRQIAEAVQKTVAPVSIESLPARPGDFGGKEVSSRRAFDDLGWVPRTKFEEGLRRYVAWYRSDEAARQERWDLVDQS